MLDSNHFKRRLDPSRGYKPLDFGNGVLAGSVAPDGRLLTLSTYHPMHGYVTMSSMAPFPDELRHDQTAVRTYRAALAQPSAPTFGLRFMESTSDYAAYLLQDVIPHCRFRVGSLSVDVTTWAPRLSGEAPPVAVQAWALHNPADQPVTITYAWDGAISLSRASYTQLTESGALPPISTTLQLTFDNQTLQITAPEVKAVAVILGLPPASGWERTGHVPLSVVAQGSLRVPPGQTVQLRLVYGLGQSLHETSLLVHRLAAADLQASFTAVLDAYADRWRILDSRIAEPVRRLVHRAQAYALDCCAVPVGTSLCLLTDHQILPLSWTRDAYFTLQGLCLQPNAQMLDLLHRHLIWLFEIAWRPDGYWGRAYLASGQPKDRVFQLDQQCYPLLELAEYAALGGDVELTTRLVQHIPAVLQIILDRQAPGTRLFATEETPADDPLPFPYHFSSHVLLWHTLRQLADLNRRWSFTMLDLVALAEAVRAAVQRHLVAEYMERALFAYATDLSGGYRFYHDANDLPTVLAPLWGFCTADDQTWRATMDFAFGSGNVGGYYAGPVGGLGSIHTPGAWPLGDIQELLYARMIGDTHRMQAVLNRLVTTACWDGALPEARDPISGAVRSRHWFAWPNAALVLALQHPF